MAKKSNKALRPKQELRKRKKVHEGRGWTVKLLEILQEKEAKAN
ncbi:hypothetical protein U2I54_20005 [Bacillus pseudomycoides]|uniref:Uncharacterized protein n=1 Tax=Bacillus bingmayongensis TaxID=1150157 RepID=A0ABU5K0T6_9BACI|nr:hypothetical protein [Bacillus pseudomycoides]